MQSLKVGLIVLILFVKKVKQGFKSSTIKEMKMPLLCLGWNYKLLRIIGDYNNGVFVKHLYL